jgi:hypothetical protein
VVRVPLGVRREVPGGTQKVVNIFYDKKKYASLPMGFTMVVRRMLFVN